MNNELFEYLDSLNECYLDDHDKEMSDYAKEHSVPIIQQEGLDFLRQLVMLRKPMHILEIGSAIGFSSINMAKYSNAFITTVEIDANTYNIAVKNIEKAGLNERINIINADALENNLINEDQRFDLIFIDAAKAQYSKFFDKYKEYLNDGGVIMTDNLLFHGLVVSEIKNKNLRQLVGKIKKFNEFVMKQDDFFTRIYNIGDGIALSIKK